MLSSALSFLPTALTFGYGQLASSSRSVRQTDVGSDPKVVRGSLSISVSRT